MPPSKDPFHGSINTFTKVWKELDKLAKCLGCIKLCDLMKAGQIELPGGVATAGDIVFVIQDDGSGPTCKAVSFPSSLGVTAFVTTWADLPDPALHCGEVYYVLTATGTPWWPPTYKSDGFWISNCVTWKPSATLPINATLAQAIAGVDDINFITSLVLNQWFALQTAPGANGILNTFPAGEVINGGKALILDVDGKVYNMDITNGAHHYQYVGIATNAAILNDPVIVISEGVTTVLGSGWTSGLPYYISSTGFLSNTPPVTGFCKQVGVGVSLDKINIVNYSDYILI